MGILYLHFSVFRHIHTRKPLKYIEKFANMSYQNYNQNANYDQNYNQNYNQNQFYNQQNTNQNWNQPPPVPPVDYRTGPTAPPAYTTPTTQPPPNASNQQPKLDTAPEASYQFQNNSTNLESNQPWSLDNFANRQSFIKKVYFTLSIQLLITFIPIILCDIFVSDNYVPSSGMFWSAWAIQLAAFFMLCCGGERLARKFPTNIIFLGVFTLAETYLLTVITLYYDADSVFMAVGATFAVTVTVTLMATCTNYDFTKLLPAMCCVLMGWFFVSFFFIFFWNSYMQVIYAGIGVTIFTIFLAIDTKMLLGGGRFEFSEDDYIYACLNLYLDIINIFMYMLRIFGMSD